MRIGHKIERIRKLRGLSQAVLGKSLGGISKQAVSKIEQRTCIDETTIRKIAIILDITPEGLKSFDPEIVLLNMMTPISKIEVETDNENNHMSKETKDLCLFYEKMLRSEKKVQP
ncbi:helix-turn-helix transcriptional regulator [Gramella sp. AN32]|uniref:Helix-turn-helix domain-containing protein n=1 Tax=Christiangramia antarctica TaxID=2058158 RepID=A0ABW5XA12_9FLAO|nr:helix-turn-helix transcriptional regulator [Gramella sp. AN32]MCM4154416.1 XRE family transcriptional regulator [Gramella sp. AN32]